MIVNPAAAGGRAGRRLGDIGALLGAAGVDCEIQPTLHPGHATQLARAAIREGRPAVVAAGGDGTLNEVANGFFEGGAPIPTGCALGILPLGSGGDFRRSFGMTTDLGAAARVIAAGRRRRIDAGRATYATGGDRAVRHFINIADAGIGGEVVARVNRSSKPLGGTVAFYLASVRALATWRNRPVHVTVDRESRDLTAQQVVVANGQYFGGGMRMAPEAQPDDGLFDVILVGDVGMVENVRGLSRIRSGTHLQGGGRFEILRGARVEVSSQHEILIDLDGEQPGRLPALFEVMPQALDLIVP